MPLLILLLWIQTLVGAKDRALKMAIGIDQAGNAGIGGSEDETISSRAGRAKRDGKRWGPAAVAFIDFFFGKGHCEANIGI